MSTIIRLPGLVDPHVHLREPGAEQKEDFGSGTRAALAGGYTLVLDMPNNPTPTVDAATLADKKRLAAEKIVCDVGFHIGGSVQVYDGIKNVVERNIRARLGYDVRNTLLIDEEIKIEMWQYFSELAPQSFGLKLYLGETHGPLVFPPERADELTRFVRIMVESWPEIGGRPIMLHATGETLKETIYAAPNPADVRHICHISTADDVAFFRGLKESGNSITAEVTPHHLFLTRDMAEKAELAAFAKVSPPLGTQADVDALWAALADGTIDMIATDHAPHTRAEKEATNPPYGIPGLETALPLLLGAVTEGRISLERLTDAMSTAPRRIFHLPTAADQQAEIEVELFAPGEMPPISAEGLQTKAGWTPFASAGLKAGGRVRGVWLHGAKVYEDGQILAAPGSGRVLP